MSHSDRESLCLSILVLLAEILRTTTPVLTDILVTDHLIDWKPPPATQLPPKNPNAQTIYSDGEFLALFPAHLPIAMKTDPLMMMQHTRQALTGQRDVPSSSRGETTTMITASINGMMNAMSSVTMGINQIAAAADGPALATAAKIIEQADLSNDEKASLHIYYANNIMHAHQILHVSEGTRMAIWKRLLKTID
ncbi:hypothetical protein P691DRAFT_763858 [Macrolepiota fuliginosa MF-IS2]|uniref:Uncharacterized protein n=1 Tax=Macrolepiota fuliginosa MF-IS2 TaxID=1400762 RepID=A0A9P5X4H0_9AGAR|nr:hypothetical protein P691DRAFT_763858 [Macrolepiota fuliginosa MF-IS2]